MVVVLAAVAVFVHARMRSHLDESIDNGLRSRTDDVAALVDRSGSRAVPPAGRAADPEEGFAQVLTERGELAGGSGPAALSPAEAGQAARAPITRERGVPPVEGEARLFARPAGADGRGRGLVVVAVGSLDDRDETLAALLTAFAVGGGLAVLVASGLGYALAGMGLRPVEAMSRRAARVSLEHGGERLPLSAAHDEIRHLGQTLNSMLERLEASFERERRFVADASHELRTPLTVVKTELESALRTGGDDPQHREALVAALDETDHLVQLAEDLLLIARSADGRLPVRAEDVDVADLLARTRERFADRAGAQGRSIVVRAPAGMRARLDPLRLRQALGNVVDNALRHGGGTVVMAARADGAGTVAIEVSDEGPGFPPELAEHAFERFTRGDRSDQSRTREGTGLGLAIVRAVVEAHGGTASIDGAAVILRLPSRSSHPHLSDGAQAAAKSTEGA